MAKDHEKSHGRDTTWTLRAKEAPDHIKEKWPGTSWMVEMVTEGTRDGEPFRRSHLYCFTRRTSQCDTSLRTTPEALLQLVRDRWSIESWHWIRDTQLHEDAYRYRGNGAGAMANSWTAGLNMLRFKGFQSIRPACRW